MWCLIGCGGCCLVNVWKSLLGVFGFSGWNCFKNYEKVEEGGLLR